MSCKEGNNAANLLTVSNEVVTVVNNANHLFPSSVGNTNLLR